MAEIRPLRVALLSYRSKPHGGGQGVYVRHLSKELVAAGHEVTVFSGQPYPELLDARVRLEKLPSLDLYREPDPFRTPARGEFRDLVDVAEYLGMRRGAFPEPLTFTMRAARALASRTGDFDVVHDNQSLGWGLLSVARRFPLVTTIHHPITRDRAAETTGADARERRRLRRWYSFLPMQAQVARAQSHVVTVSQASATAIAEDFGVSCDRIEVIPLGVETEVFRPEAAPARVPGRIVVVATQDSPVKGVDTVLHAAARLRHARGDGAFTLVMVCPPRPGGLAETLVRELGLGGVVQFRTRVPAPELAGLLASASVVATPSRYEGFSLPTLEAMSCGTPLVVTRAGALPEVVGADTGAPAALLVEPGDPGGLADALGKVLDDPRLAATLGQAGRRRAVSRYDWASVARRTAQVYARAIAEWPGDRARGRGGPFGRDAFSRPSPLR